MHICIHIMTERAAICIPFAHHRYLSEFGLKLWFQITCLS